MTLLMNYSLANFLRQDVSAANMRAAARVARQPREPARQGHRSHRRNLPQVRCVKPVRGLVRRAEQDYRANQKAAAVNE
jgi:hypothetical protein